ncbi:hypothetical protein HY632_04150, partial [Candidatus Uhrbacteria bacterium]|nr:hypothetical protein [Candidatus Uhrbacteria bacterium]
MQATQRVYTSERSPRALDRLYLAATLIAFNDQARAPAWSNRRGDTIAPEDLAELEAEFDDPVEDRSRGSELFESAIEEMICRKWSWEDLNLSLYDVAQNVVHDVKRGNLSLLVQP